MDWLDIAAMWYVGDKVFSIIFGVLLLIALIVGCIIGHFREKRRCKRIDEQLAKINDMFRKG